MISTLRTLLLLRHATAEPAPAGGRDLDRPLSSRGRAEADGVGDFLRSGGLVPDLVLCSPATRTRETLERLGLDVPVDVVPLLYQARSWEILELAAAANLTTVLVVGHAPGLPELASELAEPVTSSAAASDRFPPATLAQITVTGSWADQSAARLRSIRLPSGRGGRLNE